MAEPDRENEIGRTRQGERDRENETGETGAGTCWAGTDGTVLSSARGEKTEGWTRGRNGRTVPQFRSRSLVSAGGKPETEERDGRETGDGRERRTGNRRRMGDRREGAARCGAFLLGLGARKGEADGVAMEQAAG